MIIVLVGLTTPLPAGDESVSHSMSVSEFQQLSLPDQKTILASVFERRLQHAKNVSYESVTRGRNCEYHDGRVGEPIWNGRRDVFRHWRLGDSYRMEYDRYPQWKDGDPDNFGSSGFNAAEGTVRGTFRAKNSERVSGRIDVKHSPPTEANRYAYWLDGEHNAMAQYLIRYLVEHQEEYTIEAPFEGDKVRLTVPWKPIHSDKPLGIREFIIEPQKGFLPIRGYARREQTLSSGKPHWRTEEFIVEESRLVGDVWMPTKLKEIIGSAILGPNVVNVYETEVRKIEAGTVKPEDLEVKFPEGTEVIDAIKGLHYFTDASGNPAGAVEKEVGGMFLNEIPAYVKPPFPWGRWLFIAGVVIVVAGIAVHFVRRARARG